MYPAQDQGDELRHCGASKLNALVLGLIAATPILFAAATWDSVGVPSYQWALRFFGVPILCVEVLTLYSALVQGFSPTDAIARLSLPARSLLSVLIAVAFGTALLVAPDQAMASVRTIMNIIHLLFAMAVLWLLRERWQYLAGAIWPAIVAGTCGFALLAFVFAALVPHPERFDWKYFGLAVTNVRQLGFYSSVGTAAALGMVATRHDRRSYGLYTFAATMLLGLSWWSGTRGGPMAVLIACGAGSLVWPRMRTLRVVSALIVSFTISALASLLYPIHSPYFGVFRIFYSVAEGSSADDMSSGRLLTWLGTLRKIAERPLFGWGEGQFRTVVPEAWGEFNHPHNFILQSLLQWGVVGTAAFLGLVGMTILRLIPGSRFNREQTTPALLVAGTLVAYACFEGTLFHPWPIMVLGLSVAVVLAQQRAHAVVSAYEPWPSVADAAHA